MHDYGDLCQSIMEMASEQAAPISVEEFGVLNIRLDNAIAGAVTEYAQQSESLKVDEHKLATNQRLALLAGEMRNLLNTTIIAISAIKGGGVGFGGATAAALDRSLIRLRGLIDRTLAEVRLEDGDPVFPETIELASFIAEVRVASALEASTSGCELAVTTIEPGIFMEADRHLLASAVSNLLQNAFGCTHGGGGVLLGARASEGSVLIEVEEASPRGAAAYSRPDARDWQGREWRGPGSVIALIRQEVEAGGGRLSIREIPGRGCVYTIALPRKSQSAAPQSVRVPA